MALYDQSDLSEYILALKSENLEVRKKASWELVKFEAGSVSKLILKEINDKQNQLYVRCEAIQILGKLEVEEAFQALTNFIWDEDNQIRHYAIHALRYRGDKRAFEPVSRLLEDGDNYIRGSAAAALGDIQESKAIPLLINILLNDSFAFTRSCAAYSLGRLKAHKSLDVLVSALSDKDFSVRQSVVEAMIDLKISQANEVLTDLMENIDTDWNLRLEIASRLALIETNKRAIQLIVQALGEEAVPEKIVGIAVGLGNRMTLALIEALKSSDRLFRLRATQALKYIGDARAIKGLSDLAEQSDNDLQLKELVLEALAVIRHKQEKED